jgi:hypothetical protein
MSKFNTNRLKEKDIDISMRYRMNAETCRKIPFRLERYFPTGQRTKTHPPQRHGGTEGTPFLTGRETAAGQKAAPLAYSIDQAF